MQHAMHLFQCRARPPQGQTVEQNGVRERGCRTERDGQRWLGGCKEESKSLALFAVMALPWASSLTSAAAASMPSFRSASAL